MNQLGVIYDPARDVIRTSPLLVVADETTARPIVDPLPLRRSHAEPASVT
jgi:hypothetical protein